MPIQLVPLRETDLEAACHFIVEGREWSPRTDIFVPPMAVLSAPNSRWYSALNGDQLLGVVGFHGIVWEDSTAEIFTALAPNWRGKGLAASLVKMQLDTAFNDLGLRRITMLTLPDSPSAKIAEKMKVPIEGRFPRARLKRGVYVDAVAYGLEKGK